MLDPLHQFVIHPIFRINVGGFDLSFTNSSLAVLLTTTLIISLFSMSVGAGKLVPGRMQAIGELAYTFIAEMIRENAGNRGMKYFPFVFSVFIFILFGNLLGMIPYMFTFTSHIIVTFTLAMIVFLVVTVIGLALHGMKFINLFIPKGLPAFLAPILLPIELISYLSRPISLAVRLFANMMAGHTMMKVFAGFAAMTGLFGICPIFVNVILTGFEIVIAALQAYVFTILTCVYLNDAIHLH
jgi:F-type H+-transporting ATPase subunit a